MVTSTSSVTFNSKEAERNVTSYANKIGQLNTRIKEANTAARSFGTTASATNTKLTAVARQADTVSGALRNLAYNSRQAIAAFDKLGASATNGGLAKAAGIIRSLSSELSNASTRMKSMQASSAGFASSISKLNSSSNSAVKNINKISDALAKLVPSAQTSSRYMAKLASALASVASGSASAASALRGVTRSSDDAGRGLRGAGAGAESAGRQMASLNRNLGLTAGELYGVGVEAVRLRNTMSFLAAGFGIHELVDAADGYKLLHGRLQIVSGSAAELTTNYKALLASANYTRTNLEDNANMFTRLMIAGKQYNMTAKDALRLTENVNMALTISGATAGEAAAATQQLAQAFSSGRLQGDELRSVLENAPILAVALTEQLKDMGVTMANLREKAKKGEIGINQLMQAFANPLFTQKLKEQFDQVPLTIGQALTVVKNNLQDYIGSVDSASGASGTFANSLVWLSQNIDGLARVAEVLIGVIGVRMAAALVTMAARSSIATAATAAFSGVLAGTTTVMEATAITARATGAALSAAFGGGIGLLIAGVAVGVGLLWERSMAAQQATESLNQSIKAQTAYFMAQNLQQVSASRNMSDLSKTQMDVLTSTASLTGEVGKLADQWARVAAAAKAAQLEQARARERTAMNNYESTRSALRNRTNDTFQSVANEHRPFAERGLAANAPTGNSAAVLAKTNAIVAGTKEFAMNNEARTNYWAARRDRQNVELAPLATFKPQNFAPASPSTPSGGGGGGSSRGSGKADNSLDEIRRKLDTLAAKTSDADEAMKKWKDGIATLDAAMSKNLINADRYDKVAGNLANTTFPGLTDAVKELANENARLQLDANGVDASTAKFREQADVVRDMVSWLDEVVAKEGDKTGKLQEQRKVLLSQLDTYGQLLQRNVQLNAEVKQREEAERQITEIIDDASNQLYRLLTQRISDALDGSVGLFKGFFSSILKMAKDTFASMIGAYIFAPLQRQFRSVLEGAFGLKSSYPIGSQAQAGTGRERGALTTKEIAQTVISIGSSTTATTAAAAATKAVTAANDNNTGDIVVSAPKKQTGFFGTMMNSMKQTVDGTFTSAGKSISELGTMFKPIGKALAPVGKLFKPVLDKLGGLPTALGKLAGGAAIGSSVSGLAGAVGVKLNGTGSAIGGAIGQVVPVIGPIIGSILGGITGNLFTKIKRGSGSVSNNAVTVANSNDKGISDSLNQSGSSIQAGVRSIAEKLGGSVGSYNVGIGRYKDYYQVSSNPNDPRLGRSEFTKYSASAVYDGKDAEEAMRAAISEAIRQGAVVGVSEGVKNLITKRGGDMEVQLDKALRFQSVIDAFKQMTNPVGYALDQVGKQFSGITDIFKEANATASDWAALQSVVQAQFDKTLKDMQSGLLDFRDSLMGGDLSFKSASDKLSAADAKFRQIEADIASGKYVDQSTFTKAGQDLQSLAREVYGSTPDFAAYQDRLLTATDKLIANTNSEAEKYKPIVDALKEQTAAAQNATDTTNSLLQQILAATGTGGYDYTTLSMQAGRANF